LSPITLASSRLRPDRAAGSIPEREEGGSHTACGMKYCLCLRQTLVDRRKGGRRDLTSPSSMPTSMNEKGKGPEENVEKKKKKKGGRRQVIRACHCLGAAVGTRVGEKPEREGKKLKGGGKGRKEAGPPICLCRALQLVRTTGRGKGRKRKRV